MKCATVSGVKIVNKVTPQELVDFCFDSTGREGSRYQLLVMICVGAAGCGYIELVWYLNYVANLT